MAALTGVELACRLEVAELQVPGRAAAETILKGHESDPSLLVQEGQNRGASRRVAASETRAEPHRTGEAQSKETRGDTWVEETAVQE